MKAFEKLVVIIVRGVYIDIIILFGLCEDSAML